MKRSSLSILLLLVVIFPTFAFKDPKYSNLEFTVLDEEAKTVSVKAVDKSKYTAESILNIPSSATKPAAKRAPAIRKLEQIMCPLCGKGHILKGRTAYGCSEFRAGCSLRLDFSEYPADLTPGKLNAAIKKKFGK